MKNILILAVLCLTFASCDKSYTCECKNQGADTLFTSWPVNSVREADAKDKCTSYQDKYNINQGMSLVCTVK